MRAEARPVRRVLIFVAAVCTAALSLTATTAAAAPPNTGGVLAAHPSEEAKAAALTARRALVARDTSATAEKAAAQKAAPKAVAPPESGSSEAGSKADAPAKKASSSTADVSGVPNPIWLTGPGGTQLARGNIQVISPTMVAPGEQLTASAEIWNSYLVELGEPASAPATVVWSLTCGGVSETLATQEGVDSSAEDEPSAPVSSVTFNTPTDCPGWPSQFEPPPAPLMSVNVAVTPDGGLTGSAAENVFWAPVDAASVTGCLCLFTSAGARYSQADAGDDVSTATGGYTDSVQDAALATPGQPLDVDRSYSSADTTTGSLGPGWSVPWQANLAVDSSTGAVTFTAENGDQYLYTPDSETGFYSLGNRSVLTATVDSSGTTTGYVLTTPSNNVLTFDASGRLLTETDSTARGLAFSYDSANQVSSITDAAGQTVTLTYNGSLLSQISLPDGQDIDYGFTGGLLTSVATPGGASGPTTTYTYDSAGRLATVENADQNDVVRNTYDSAGRIASQQDGVGDTTSFAYTTTPSGLQETDVTDPNGGITSYLYAGSMLVELIDPLNAASAFVYNSCAEPTELVDPLGGVTTYGYSGCHLTSVTDPLGKKQSWTYTGNDVASYTDPGQNTTTFTYNAMNEPTSETTPTGGKSTLGYDAAGNLVSAVDPRGNASGASAPAYTTTYTYSSTGQLTGASGPNGMAETYTYNAMGYPLTVAGPGTGTTSIAYDAADRIVSVTTPGDAVTAYSYDAVGNLLTRTDPDHNTWSYQYDADNRVVTATDPLGRSTTDTYDGDGNQATVTDARGIVTTTKYNGDNRPASVTYSDGTPGVTYSYDVNGDTTGITDGTGSTTLTYDADGRVLTDGGFTYAYNADGAVTSRKYPDGTALTYAYNQDDEMSSMTDGSATTTYGYDPAGNLLSALEPNGVTETRSYNGPGQLTGITDATSSATLDSYALTLDAEGEPAAVAVTQAGVAQPTQYYGYDTAGRMTSACYSTTGSGACTSAALGSATGTAPNPAPGPPTGPLTETTENQCLTVTASGGSTEPVRTAACNGSAAQVWTVEADGTVQHQGSCLAVGTAVLGTAQAQLTACNGSAAQQWTATSSQQLENPGQKECLTVSKTVGATVTVQACTQPTLQTFKLPPPGITYAPTSVAVTAGVESATVTWAAPVSGGPTVTGYTVTASPGGATASVGPSVTSASLSGLTAGAAYTFTVAANSASGSVASAPTSAVTPGNEFAYSYDAAGNLVGTIADGQSTTNTYNADEELALSTAGAVSTAYGYDAAGDRTSAGADTFSYNGAGEMSGADTPAGDYTYGYDYAGDLVSTDQGGSLIQGTRWDVNGTLPRAVENTSSTGASTADFVYNPDGTLASLATPSAAYGAVTDWLGSVTGLVTSAGSQATTTDYGPYGQPQTTNLVGGAPASSIGYAGSYSQPGGTGLADMRARDYDPATGQFTTVDPLLEATDTPYLYAGDDPATFTDPSGKCSQYTAVFCDIGGWLLNNGGNLSTGIGMTGLGLGVICPECEGIGLVLGVSGSVLGTFGVIGDYESCAFTTAGFDSVGLGFGIDALAADAAGDPEGIVFDWFSTIFGVYGML